MERCVACEGGISNQSVAERRAGISPLDLRKHSRQQILRPLRSRVADLQRQQFPRWPGKFLSGDAESRAGRNRANREMADESTFGHGGVLWEGWLEIHLGVEGGNHLL